MKTINVLLNSDQSEVVGYFGSPQDPEIWPNQGVAQDDDPRWIEYLISVPVSNRGGLPGEIPAPTAAELFSAAQAAKIAELSAACKASIYAGFTSDALATGYTYPAKDTDQQNLASSVIDSLLSNGAAGWVTPFWCADNEGSWAFRMHTAAQIQQVGKDAKAAVLSAMAKNQALVGRVAAATTADAVNAIAWG